MVLVEMMMRLEYCHEVLCKRFLTDYQDVNVLYVQVSLKLYVNVLYVVEYMFLSV